MGTKSNWLTGRLRFFDAANSETIRAMAPIYFEDDFIGADAVIPASGSAESGVKWTKKIVANGLIAKGATAAGNSGILTSSIVAADAAQQAILHMNDLLDFNLANGLVFECRAAFTTLPTGAGGELTTLLIGLGSAYNVTPDTVTYNAWFRWEGNASALWETDNNVTDADDNATGVTTLVNVYNRYKIDASVPAATKFYINDVLVGTSDLSALTTTTGLIGPYIGGMKAKAVANATVGVMNIDYVKIWQNR